MYFPVLEKLREFNVSVNEIKQLDSLLFLIYDKGYHQRFNPRVYRYFGMEVNEKVWLSLLEKLSKVGLMKINFEVTCPHCDETIEVYDSYDGLPIGQSKSCPNCGKEFMVSEKDIFIMYSFKETFKPSHSRIDRRSFFHENSQVDSKFTLEDLKRYPEVVYSTILNPRKTDLINLLNDIASSDKISPQEKGNKLENLAKKLLESPYLKIIDTKKRTSTGEIDIVFEVKKFEGTIFHNFSDILIVECKNWEMKVSANELRSFADKMRDTDTTVGIFFSRYGITGDSEFVRDAKGIIRDKWKTERKIIIVLTYNDLRNVIEKGMNFYKLLKEKYYEVKTI
ncbi:MAG: hypothetical protein DRP84_11230 [Spirochaetes bacterium]|nr:MAG: hypothetical protein DRP84_11230 [Spirochaetota bacterium]